MYVKVIQEPGYVNVYVKVIQEPGYVKVYVKVIQEPGYVNVQELEHWAFLWWMSGKITKMLITKTFNGPLFDKAYNNNISRYLNLSTNPDSNSTIYSRN